MNNTQTMEERLNKVSEEVLYDGTPESIRRRELILFINNELTSLVNAILEKKFISGENLAIDPKTELVLVEDIKTVAKEYGI